MPKDFATLHHDLEQSIIMKEMDEVITKEQMNRRFFGEMNTPLHILNDIHKDIKMYTPKNVQDQLDKMKNESIIDPLHKEMNPDIWEKKSGSSKPLLKEPVKKEIVKRLEKFFSDMKVDVTKVKNLLLVGSITGYKYTSHSDLDVNVGVDVSDEELVKIQTNVMQYNEKNYANTEHPINFYVLPYQTKLQTGDFMWDIKNDKWIKNPKQVKSDLDYLGITVIVQSQCRNYDEDEGELKRDIIDYFLLKHDLEEIHELVLPKKEVDELIRKKITEIFADLDTLKRDYVELHSFRMEGFGTNKEKFLTKIESNIVDNNLQLSNILWKHCEKYGYVDRLKQYKNIHKLLIENNKKIDDKIETEFKKLL